jgi:hypothetical protein
MTEKYDKLIHAILKLRNRYLGVPDMIIMSNRDYWYFRWSFQVAPLSMKPFNKLQNKLWK